MTISEETKQSKFENMRAVDVAAYPVPSSTGSTEPEREHWQWAIACTKHLKGIGSTKLKHGTEGPMWIRFYLGQIDRCYQNIPLDHIRETAETISKTGGGEPRTKEEPPPGSKDLSALSRLRNSGEDNRAQSHSQAYENLHDSKEFRELKEHLCKLKRSHCEVCARQVGRANLDLHLPHYGELEPGLYEPKVWNGWPLALLVCRDCHPVIQRIIDLSGKLTAMTRDEQLDLFCD